MADQRASSSSTASARHSEGTSTNSHPSPAQMTPVKISSHFTQSQLALALTIQKSKPETLSTSEYCQQLKIHVTLGGIKSTKVHRYVDTVEFWKDQYTKIHVEKRLLEDKVRCLKERQRLLLQTSSLDDSHLPNHQESQIGQSSCHSIIDGQVEKGTSRKRIAAEDLDRAIRAQHEDRIYPPSSADDILLRLILRLRRQRASLENASKSANSVTEIDELARCSHQVLLILDSSLSDCCIPFQILKTSDENKQNLAIFLQLMDQIGLSFLSCFKALNELCRTILGRSRKVALLYQMVMFFNMALDLLHTISALQAECNTVKDTRRPRTKRSRMEEGEYVVNKYLARTLATVAYSLEWKVHLPGHSDLLEGILFSVLKHVGRLVSEAIFAEHVAKSGSTGNITESSETPSRSGIASSESRYFVQILHAALGGPDKKELVAQVLVAGKTDVDIQKRLDCSTGPNALKSDLLTKAKSLIQSTLVKSAVGGTYLETMSLPPAPAEDLARLTQNETEGERYEPDWLIETVWTLIGWDLVA